MLCLRQELSQTLISCAAPVQSRKAVRIFVMCMVSVGFGGGVLVER